MPLEGFKQCLITFGDRAEEGLIPGKVVDVFAEEVNCEWTLKTQWCCRLDILGGGRSVIGAIAVGKHRGCLESAAGGPRGCWEVRLKSQEFRRADKGSEDHGELFKKGTGVVVMV